MVAVTDFDYIVFTVVFHWKSRKNSCGYIYVHF